MKTVVAGVVVKDGMILIAQRRSGSLAGKWEFPGGKVEGSETPQEALRREFDEEFGVIIEVGDFVDEVDYSVDGKDYTLLAFHVIHISGHYKLLDHMNLDWVRPELLISMDLAPPDVPIANQLIEVKYEF